MVMEDGDGECWAEIVLTTRNRDGAEAGAGTVSGGRTGKGSRENDSRSRTHSERELLKESPNATYKAVRI